MREADLLEQRLELVFTQELLRRLVQPLVLVVVGETTAQKRHDVLVVELVERVDELRVGDGRIQARHDAAGADDAHHLAHDLLVVGRVAQPEADDGGVERVVVERQAHGVALDEHDVLQVLRAVPRDVEHLRGEVEPRDEDVRVVARDALGDVSRAAADVEHQPGARIGMRAGGDGNVFERLLPQAVHAEREAVVCGVVLLGNRLEDAVYVFFGHWLLFPSLTAGSGASRRNQSAAAPL